VPLVAGTDRLIAPATGLPSIHAELELLVSHGGPTPLEALTAATATAARVLGVDDEFGTSTGQAG
jgi:imidazolonepropionase-like amidohydrolase